MHKKGQFFLIAAIVIIMIVIGLGTIYVSTNSQSEDTQTIDLSEELDFEASQLIDNGVFLGNSEAQILNNTRDLTISYAKLYPDSDIAIFYGDRNSVHAISIETENSGSVGFNLGGNPSNINLSRRVINERADFPADSPGRINLRLSSNTTIPFELKEGQNFFVVIKKEKGDERTIAAQ